MNVVKGSMQKGANQAMEDPPRIFPSMTALQMKGGAGAPTEALPLVGIIMWRRQQICKSTSSISIEPVTMSSHAMRCRVPSLLMDDHSALRSS